MSLTEELLVSSALRISASAAGCGAVKALEVKSGYTSSQTDFVFHLFVCLFLLKMKVVELFCRKYLSVKTQFKPFYWIIRCFLRASLEENDVYFRLFMRPKCELSSLGGRNVNQKKQTK